MIRRFIIIFLIFLCCLSISANIWDFPGSDAFKNHNKLSCAKNYTYRDNLYTDCTTDGDNGDIPWCSITPNYVGLIAYCVDFQNTSLQCLPSFTMPDGKVYNKCDYLSPTAKYKQCKTNHPVIKYRYCTDALQNPIKKALERRTDCDPTYEKLSKDHTMW